MSSSLAPQTDMSQAANLDGLGDLIKLLPTGTVFLFQVLNSVVTNYGQCYPFNKVLSYILIICIALFCFFSSFTDSYKDDGGNTVYGFVTPSGLWTTSPPSPNVDLSSYRLRVSDVIHAFLSLTVVLVVVLLDHSTVECFYPSLVSEQMQLLVLLPPVIGVLASSFFLMFPTKRHWIGYPSPHAACSPSTAPP